MQPDCNSCMQFGLEWLWSGTAYSSATVWVFGVEVWKMRMPDVLWTALKAGCNVGAGCGGIKDTGTGRACRWCVAGRLPVQVQAGCSGQLPRPATVVGGGSEEWLQRTLLLLICDPGNSESNSDT
eukprot:356798-Chlamydomonas_euryale.AAC.2